MFLVKVDPRHAWNRILGAFAALYGLQTLTFNLATMIRDDPVAFNAWFTASVLCLLPLGALLLLFGTSYPMRIRLWARWPWAQALVLLPPLAGVLLLISRPALFIEGDPVYFEALDKTLPASPPALTLASAALLLGLAVAVLGLARGWLLAKTSHERTRTTFVLAPVLLIASNLLVYDLARSLALFEVEQARQGDLVWVSVGAATLGIAALAGVAMLLAPKLRAPDNAAAREASLLLGLMLVPAGIAMLDIALIVGGVGSLDLRGVFAVLWVPFLVFGIARYQVVEADLRLKKTTFYGSIVAIEAGIYLVVSETLEAVFAEDVFGELLPFSGLIAAGLAGLSVAPVAALTRKLINRVFIGVDESDAYLARKKLEVYRATLEGALRDGVVSDKELRVIAHFRENLGITEREHQRIEAEVRRSLGLGQVPRVVTGKRPAVPAGGNPP